MAALAERALVQLRSMVGAHVATLVSREVLADATAAVEASLKAATTKFAAKAVVPQLIGQASATPALLQQASGIPAAGPGQVLQGIPLPQLGESCT